MSTILFLAKTQRFSGNAGAGTGTVVQTQYTVPNGKRAELRHVYQQINNNGNAANTTFALVTITVGGVTRSIAQFNGSGLAAISFLITQVNNIDLQAGDTVNLVTINTGVGAVAMTIDIVVREYQ